MNIYPATEGLMRSICVPAMAAPPGGQQSSQFPMLLMFGMIALIWYTLVLRPQQKKQKEQKEMLASIRKGDQVITSGGIHGIVAGVKDDVVLLKVADNVKIELSKGAISTITKREAEPA